MLGYLIGHPDVPPRLLNRWLITTLVYTSVLAASFLVVRDIQAVRSATHWALGASIAAVYLIGYLRSHLHENRRDPGGPVLPSLGLANAITLSRGLAYSLLAGFIALPRLQGVGGWLPALLFLGAGLTDLLDGYLARLRNHTTRLGEQLDREVDALGVLVAVLLGIHYGQLPTWYLAVGAAYYVFKLHLYVRQRRGRPVHPLPPSALRPWIGGFQVGFLFFMLWPVLGPPETTFAASIVVIPFLASFARDWAFAVGRLSARSSRYLTVRRGAQFVFHEWLPTGLRLLTTSVAGLVLSDALYRSESWLYHIASFNFTVSPAIRSGVLILLVASMLLLALGIAGRVAATGLLMMACVEIITGPFTLTIALLLGGVLYVMMLGTGAYSLWEPIKTLLKQRVAEQA